MTKHPQLLVANRNKGLQVGYISSNKKKWTHGGEHSSRKGGGGVINGYIQRSLSFTVDDEEGALYLIVAYIVRN